MSPLLSTAILRAQSDERLMALAREGHERAFEALVERYHRPLLRHVRRVLPELRAEDAVQQAFLNAWSALERGVEVHEPRAWLYRVSQNAALNVLRGPGYEYEELRDSLRAPGAGPAEDHERAGSSGARSPASRRCPRTSGRRSCAPRLRASRTSRSPRRSASPRAPCAGSSTERARRCERPPRR
jgi:DNA-directed RNA polymerase specialized sigma24 family protein